MEELVSVMMEIRDQLIELNSKMDVLTGHGSNSLSDITEAIESIKGSAGYDSLIFIRQLRASRAQLDMI